MPPIVQQSMIKCWHKISVPSPSIHDSTVKKKDGKLIRNCTVRNIMPNGKIQPIDYQRIQKRFYTEQSKVVYENWKIDNHQLLQRECLDKRQKIPHHSTFKRYRTHHIQKSGHLNQCRCDKCTEFTFMYDANTKHMSKIDKCKTVHCKNG